MQTIIRTTYTSNFSQISNALIESAIPAKPQKVLLYLLSKPTNWQIRFSDIKHRLGMSTYAVRQALKWLLDNGYAVFDRLKSGHTIWRIFDQAQAADTPQTRLVEPHVEIPRVENQHVLVTLRESETLIETTTAVGPVQVADASLPIESPIVVVVEKDLIDQQATTKRQPIPTPTSEPTDTIVSDVLGIDPQHQAAAKRALSRLTEEQAQMVLVAFSLQCSKSNIGNRIAYLISLTKAAIDGTFSPVGAAGGAPAITLDERLRLERQRQHEAQRRGAMNSEQHAKWLADNFGTKTPDSPAKSGGRIGLRSMLGWS